jgi:hypothetical protein
MLMDLDLSLRVAYNFEIDFIDEPLAKWRNHQGNITRTKRFLAPKEHKVLLDRLYNEIPNVKIRYKNQLLVYKRNFHMTMAREEWSKGNGAETRKQLHPYLRIPKVFLIYLCTWFMSYTFYETFKESRLEKILQYLRR